MPRYNTIQCHDTTRYNATIQADTMLQYRVMQGHGTRRYDATIQRDTISRYKAMQCHYTRRCNATIQGDTRPQYKAVNGSAKQNLPNSLMRSELNFYERRGTHVIQHNTNDTKTGEKPGYMPSGLGRLAFSTDCTTETIARTAIKLL